MAESQIMLSKRNQTQKGTYMIPFTRNSRIKTNQMFRDTADQWLFGVNVYMEDQMGRGIKRIVSGDGNVQHLDCGGGDVGVYICQTL